VAESPRTNALCRHQPVTSMNAEYGVGTPVALKYFSTPNDVLPHTSFTVPDGEPANCTSTPWRPMSERTWDAGTQQGVSRCEAVRHYDGAPRVTKALAWCLIDSIEVAALPTPISLPKSILFLPNPYLVLRDTLGSCEAYGMKPMYKTKKAPRQLHMRAVQQMCTVCGVEGTRITCA
jgi:hypothetical protein